MIGPTPHRRTQQSRAEVPRQAAPCPPHAQRGLPVSQGQVAARPIHVHPGCSRVTETPPLEPASEMQAPPTASCSLVSGRRFSNGCTFYSIVNYFKERTQCL